MRTIEDYIKNVEVSIKSDCFEVFAEVVVTYKRHKYKFTSNNSQAYYRLMKKKYVNNKVHLYGYTLKGAYEAFYKEFAKLHKVHSDKLTEIIQ